MKLEVLTLQTAVKFIGDSILAVTTIGTTNRKATSVRPLTEIRHLLQLNISLQKQRFVRNLRHIS